MTAREYLNTKMYWTQDDIPVKTVTPEDIIEWLEGYAEAVKNNAVLPLVSGSASKDEKHYCSYCL